MGTCTKFLQIPSVVQNKTLIMVAQQLQSTQQLKELLESSMSKPSFLNGENGLNECVSYVMAEPGKRFRPMLLLQSCDMFGGSTKDALGPALAIEVFHNFTLVHDDIMDKAELRRGRPTAHRTFGDNSAIIAGDMLVCHAYQLLSSMPDRFLKPVFQAFSEAAFGVMEGQQMDMDLESRIDVSETEYLLMIEKKTSVLLAAALKIGAILAEATPRDQGLMYGFGKNLGLMFQIKDDLLDTFGTQAEVGKYIGGDILQNKQTYLRVLAYCNASNSLVQRLNEAYAYQDQEWKVASVTSLFELTGARRAAELKMNQYYHEAMAALDQVQVDIERKDALSQLAQDIHSRLH